MSRKRCIPALALAWAMALSVSGVAQTSRPVTWSGDLEYLQKLTPSEATVQQGSVDTIRHEVERWLALHPNQQVKLSAAPERPWTAAQTQAQIKELSQAVTILAADEAHPFHLGQTEVDVQAVLSPLSPMAASVDQTQIQATNSISVTQALDMLPGVEIGHPGSKRNEATYYVNGFSNKQVPLYMDGIPIYVPYDGYIDLNRFLSSDLSEVQISRGYSSPLLGPGAMGGAINLVSREPQRPYEADLAIGTGSGNQLNASARLGRRAKKYFVQGGLDWAQKDYIPLSGNFRYATGGYTNLTSNIKLTNEEPMSSSRDEKYTARLGWTPKPGDEYVFSYINQKGVKDGLLYLGKNSSSSESAWKWPYWNKTSYYFLSKTSLGDKSYLKFRGYYDQLQNHLSMYDNTTYSSMALAKKYSGLSYYDDHTDGMSLEYHTRLIPRNALGFSFFFKDDTHHEWERNLPDASTAYLSPWKTLRDQQTSYGVEDSVTLTSRLHLTAGFSADHINGMTAEAYNAAGTATVPFTCESNESNSSYSGCTPHYWEYNPQAALTYSVSSTGTAFFTISKRGRFPVMKELYSSTFGTTVPNPNLKDEHSLNYNFGYTHVFNPRLTGEAQAFYSDVTDEIVSGSFYTQDATLCPGATYTAATGYKCSYSWNAGNASHMGLELDVKARPMNRVSVTANYAYLNRHIGSPDKVTSTEFTNATVTNLSGLTGVPKHKLAAIMMIDGPRQIEGMVRERYEGGIIVNDTINSASKYWSTAMAVTDLGVTVPVAKGFKAQAGVNNLLDRSYFYTAGYPEAGRNWYLNVRYQY